MTRHALVIAAALVALVAGASPGGASPTGAPAPSAGNPVFLITGHGWGHGVGMSQWGAYGYAQHGWTYERILAHYYPGTRLGPAPRSKVRVLLARGKRKLSITSDVPFRVKDGFGEMHALTPGTIALDPKLRLRLDGPKPEPLPGPLLFLPGKEPLRLKHAYRGSIEISVDAGKLQVVNFVGLEPYLGGVVPSEMPEDWAPEALKAQAVAARSYALSHLQGGAFDLFADVRSQVYLGVEAEEPETSAAVDATAGQVLLYGDEVASTFFFSTSGGRTASAEEVWGTTIPYLVSVADPYDSISPHHDWGPVSFSPAQLAKKLRVGGSVLDLQSVVGQSGRLSSVVVVTPVGEVSVAASVVRRLLGLRSTWLSVGVLALDPPAAPVTYGTATVLTGRARGRPLATLEGSNASLWEPAGTVVPRVDGSFSARVKPLATTLYRLSSDGFSTGSVRVVVTPSVRVSTAVSRTALKGSVRPAIAGATVQIQRRAGAAWVGAAHASVTAGGTFLSRLAVRPGDYRARYSPGGGLAPGLSAVLRVLPA